MTGTEHDVSDEALRVAANAACNSRNARTAHDNDRVVAGGRSHEHDHDHDRKRPRQNDEHRGAGKARRRIAPATDWTKRRLFRALDDSAGKPICEGGLAHYFVSEPHRRAQLISSPNPPVVSAHSVLAVFDEIAAASRKEGKPAGGDCPVCMEDTSCDSIALPCGHAFHKRCIGSWLQMNSSCPCCRAPVQISEPYCYPARTKLQNPLLRARVEGIGIDMREVAQCISHSEGMQSLAGVLCISVPSLPLGPVPAQHQGCPLARSLCSRGQANASAGAGL